MGAWLLFLFCFWTCTSASSLPQVLSSTYTVETASILGNDISLAIFTVDFDQDLYVPDITSPCREQTEECVPESFLACENGCDYTYNGCKNLANQTSLCCNYEKFCENADPWIDLTNGTAASHFLMNAQSVYFRFYNPDPCGPVTMHVTMRSGLVLSYGSRLQPAGAEANDWAIPTPWRPLYHFYCPYNHTSLAGTYFFTYTGKGDNAEFNVTVTSFAHEPDQMQHEPCTVPPDYSYATNDTAENIGTPQFLTACLQPNTVFHGVCEVINANYLFLYKIDGCQRLHVQLSMRTLGMDADIYGRIHDTQKDSDFLSWDYVSYLEGDDYLSMSLCGTESDPIYLTMVINCWSVEFPSNYTLIVANQSDTTYRTVPISQTFPYWEVVETAGLVRFLLPSTKPVENYTTDDWTNTFSCTDWSFTCYQIWPVYPSSDVNYFWPTPAFLVTQLRDTSLDTIQLNISQANPRKLKFAVMLQLQVDGSMQYFLTEDDLPNSSFLFYGKIVNSDGLPVYGQFNATATVPECDYNSFLNLKEQTENLIAELGNATDPILLQRIQYLLDAVRFSEAWIGCVNLLDMLFYETTVVYNQTSTDCIYPYQSDEWFSDGCCFTGIGWNTGCVPRNEAITVPKFTINNKQVGSQCAHPECAKGLLEFYQVTLENYYADSSPCTGPLAQSPTDYLISTIEAYRFCKEESFTKVFQTICYSDSDCAFSFGNFTCNIITAKCIANLTTQEWHFVECLISQMDQAQVISVQSLYNLPYYSVNDSQFVQALLSRWRSNDCIGEQATDFTTRDHYFYDNFQPDCPAFTTPKCPYIECEDTSCSLPEDSCLNFCDNFYWHFVPGYPAEACSEKVTCNWFSALCENLTVSDCTLSCGSGYYCGVCSSDGTICAPMPAKYSEDCAKLAPCLLPNGIINANLTQSICEAEVSCSHSCGYTCVGREALTEGFNAPMCVLYNTTDTFCFNFTGAVFYPGYFQGDMSVCAIVNISQPDCELLNSSGSWKYVSCADISAESCFDEYVCELRAVPCATAEACAAAGSCSDAEILVDLNSRRYGACRQDKALPVDLYFRYKLLPLCEPPLYTIPNGCVDVSILSREDCEAGNMTWLEPATDAKSCTQDQGCYEYYPELGIIGYQFAFSPKDQEICEKYATAGQFQSYWTWIPATQVHGKSLSPMWMQKQVVRTHRYMEVLNFTTAYSAYLASATAKLALQSKSSALCEYSQTIQSLTAISCDCIPGNVDRFSCFLDIGDAVTIAQVKPCGGTDESVKSSGALLYFPPNSLTSGNCSNVVVSSLTASIFRDFGAVRLASSFAQLDTNPQPYSVTNEHESVVGTVLGDGVEILVDANISNVLLCLDIGQDSTGSDYNTYDFGYATAGRSSLRPYGIQEAHLNNSAVCAVINLTAGTFSFLPIARIEKWQTKQYTLYNYKTTALIYTLAVMFTVTAIITAVTLIYLFWQEERQFSLAILLLMMVFLFTTIRAISFYIMPAGISSLVLNYILVVLPTFFYFTAFTLAVTIWAILANSLQVKKDNVKTVGLIVNALLYLFFMFVVLIFHFTGNKKDDSCGFVAISSVYSRAQRAISILYAAVIAAISLVIGVLFLVYGLRVNRILLAGNSMQGKKRKYRRTFIFALIYSFSFIMHCIFTILLEALDQPEVYFSFCGLIITEIIPSCYLSWFLSGRKNRKRKRRSSSSSSDGAKMQKFVPAESNLPSKAS